jgi:hypothetical protein
MKSKFNNITTKEFLLGVELPTETKSFKPVPNAVLINNTLEAIDKSGFSLEKEIYYTGAKGNQMLGRIGINMGDANIGMEIAFHNSYDKSLSLKYILGERLFICSNGQCYGSEGTYKSKHVGIIQTESPRNIQLYLNNLENKFENVLKRKARFEQIEVTKKTCAELLGRLYVEEEIINSTQLAIVKREIENPSFNYNADGSLWQFVNNITFSQQETNPRDYIDKSLQLFNFIEKEYV